MSTSAGVAYIDGEYVPLADARIPIIDRGFLRSDATYDVVHVWNGCFFRLDDHLDRFYRSMQGLRMSLDLTRDQIVEILTECVRRSGLRNAYVQMTCTRGVPPQGTRDPRLCKNRFYAFAQPFIWIATDQQRRDGLSLIVASTERIPPESVDPRVKNFHWLDLTMGIFQAYDRGAVVAVLPDRDNNVTEGAGFNIFAVTDDRLVTPDRGVFEGLTRQTVIELAHELKMTVELRTLPVAELRKASEIFLTSTAGGVMAVTTLEDIPVSGGKPGPVATMLNELYWQRHEQGWLATPIAY